MLQAIVVTNEVIKPLHCTSDHRLSEDNATTKIAASHTCCIVLRGSSAQCCPRDCVYRRGECQSLLGGGVDQGAEFGGRLCISVHIPSVVAHQHNLSLHCVLDEFAVQAQVVLVSEDRKDVHRDAKPDPEFGSLVYPTTQQALAFIPPVNPASQQWTPAVFCGELKHNN